MSENELSAFMDIVIDKTYDNELNWSSSIYLGGAIKYETVMLESIKITFIVADEDIPDIYISTNNHCIKIDYKRCEIENKYTKIGAQAFELKYKLEDITRKNVADQLRKIINNERR